MNNELKNKTEEWMALERMTLEQRALAERFYDENLMDLITNDYIERNKEYVFEEVNYLVISVGTSYEPITLNINLLKPERILFLCTKQSEKTLNKVVEYCKLLADKYEKCLVSETDPVDIYREIKKAYLKWDKPQKMYIDFTGGTKAMSAAGAMAGALIDIQLIYVGSDDYLADFRKPNPGSENLYYITNPLAVFGDLEIEKALTLFEEYNYSGAQEKLELLKENIPDPGIRQQLNFVYLLAKAYEAWDALDFVPAYDYLVQLNSQLRRDRLHKNFLMMDFMDKLKIQEGMLEHLKEIPRLIGEKKNMDVLQDKNTITALMFTMYQNALTREWQEKYDMATLLFYRLLEMIEQSRLSNYNLYVSQMDYLKMKYNTKRQPEYVKKTPEERFELLKESVGSIKKELFGRAGSNYLPEQVSLLEGFIILSAFHDPIVRGRETDDIAALKRIRAMVYLRNNSIFAHGLGPVKHTDFMKFRNFVEDIFKRYCAIEKIDFEKYAENIRWINPLDSGNYSMGIGEK